MESLTVNGALISKIQIVNKRVLQYNPKYQVTQYGYYWAEKVYSRSFKENDRHAEAEDVSRKLLDLVNDLSGSPSPLFSEAPGGNLI